MIKTKICSKCKLPKIANNEDWKKSDFCKSSATSDGFNYHCRECSRKYQKHQHKTVNSLDNNLGRPRNGEKSYKERMEEEINKYQEKVNGKPVEKRCTYILKKLSEETGEYVDRYCGKKFMSQGRHNRYCPSCNYILSHKRETYGIRTPHKEVVTKRFIHEKPAYRTQTNDLMSL